MATGLPRPRSGRLPECPWLLERGGSPVLGGDDVLEADEPRVFQRLGPVWNVGHPHHRGLGGRAAHDGSAYLGVLRCHEVSWLSAEVTKPPSMHPPVGPRWRSSGSGSLPRTRPTAQAPT